MLIKTGDMQPITIINPKDIDMPNAKKALETVKEEVAKKEAEDKTDGKKKKEIV